MTLDLVPESTAYQALPPEGIHVAVVGEAEQKRVVHVAIEP
jgi:hypothetical protein